MLARLPTQAPLARRAALHLIRKREELLGPLADAMRVANERILVCSACGNIDTSDPCTICRDPRRDAGVIVVVETVADLWALERASALSARYHVLGGVLSPLDGVGPKDLNIEGLLARLGEGGVREIVLAVNATVDGQDHGALHHRCRQPLRRRGHTSRVAYRVSGELDYLDEGTLTAAMRSRTDF